MMSRTVAVGLLAGATFTAVASGSYMAVRHNRTDAVAAPITRESLADPAAAPVQTETEGIVVPPAVEPPVTEVPTAPAVAPRTVEPRRAPTVRERRAPARPAPAAVPVEPEPVLEPAPPVAAPAALPQHPDTTSPPETPVSEPAAPVADPVPDEIVVPASAVIGLEIERTVTSEQAQVEDRVHARVTRDVYAGGEVAIPAGSRVTGTVTLVERGGKMKDRARLGVRFHTLVLADGRQVPLRTDTIYREGDSPGAESSRKIGGAAIGGAVLGAILGGGKGAVAGAAAGAAGGTAAVMAGGRNAATLASGSEVTVRLSAPVSIEARR